MRAAPSTCALIVAGVAACSDEVGFVSLSGLENKLVVLARAGTDARVIEAKIVDPAGAPSYFASEAGDTIHTFYLDQALVRQADGQPVAREELAIAVDQETGCSACLFPVDAPPFVLDPGSRCALPAFFEHRSDSPAEQIDAIRAQIRIERPGACVCPAENSGPVRGSLTTCEVEPGPKPHRWHQVAISDDGAIAAVHPSMILTATAGSEPVFHPLAESFIRAPALARIGTSGRRFLTVGQTLTTTSDLDEQNFVQLDGDAIEVFEPIGEVDDLAAEVLFDPTRSTVFVFGQSNEGNEGRVWRCSENFASCTASELPPCDPAGGRKRSIANAVQLPSGDIVAVTYKGHVYHLRSGSDVWECRLTELALVREEGPNADIELFAHALLVGDRLFACGHGSIDSEDADDLYAIVQSADLSLSDARWHRGEVIVHIEETPDPRCHGLWHDRQNNEVLAFFFREPNVDVYAFDLAGRFLGRRERFPGLDEPLALVNESPDHHNRVVLGVHGGLYVQRDQGALVPIGPVPSNMPTFAVARDDVETLLLGGDGPPVSWTGGCDPGSLVTKAPLDQQLEAVAGLADGRVVALSTSEVSIYDPAAGVTDRFSLALPPLKTAVAITATELVLLDTTGTARVLSLEQRSLRPLESGFQYLAGANGLAWLSGGKKLARVRRGPDGVIAELLWGDRITTQLKTGDEPIDVDAYGVASVLCGGRTAIWVRELFPTIDFPLYRARLILIEPSSSAHDYETRVLPGFSNQGRFGSSSFRSLAVEMSASVNPVLAFGDGMIIRPDSEAYFTPNPDLTSIVQRGDRAVLTDRAGLRVFLRSP